MKACRKRDRRRWDGTIIKNLYAHHSVQQEEAAPLPNLKRQISDGEGDEDISESKLPKRHYSKEADRAQDRSGPTLALLRNNCHKTKTRAGPKLLLRAEAMSNKNLQHAREMVAAVSQEREAAAGSVKALAASLSEGFNRSTHHQAKFSQAALDSTNTLFPTLDIQTCDIEPQQYDDSTMSASPHAFGDLDPPVAGGRCLRQSERSRDG